MNRRTTVRLLAATCLLFPLIMWLDKPGLALKVALGGVVWLLLATFVATRPALWLETLIVIALATTGEVMLSIGLGIYGYRSGGIPLYVPPGHGIVYLLALQSAVHLRRFERLIVYTTFVAGTVAAVGASLLFHDTFGLLCWIVIMAIAAMSRRRLLIATCVAFTSVLEISGTMLGTWEWHGRVGMIGSGNPPVGVAIFYCCVDLATLAALNALASPRQNVPCSATSLEESFLSTPHLVASYRSFPH